MKGWRSMLKLQIEGERYGRLTVKSYVKGSRWLCVCDCGSECIVRTANLRPYSKNPTRSCGCLKKELTRAAFKGRASPTRLPDKVAAANALYGAYQRQAEERDLEFSLEREEFEQLLWKPCHYCGSPSGNVMTIRSKVGPTRQVRYNGIDRINNGIGYLLSNCVPCCGQCNTMKMGSTGEEFIEHILRIVAHLKLVQEA